MSAPLDHDWETVSRHRTADGAVSYQRCRCGTHRIRLEPAPAGGSPVSGVDSSAPLETVAQTYRARRGGP